MYDAELWTFVWALAIVACSLLVIALLRRAGLHTDDDRLLIGRLTPLLYKAVWEAEKYANDVINRSQDRVSGLDKKQVANAFYDLLPHVIFIGPLPLPVGVVKLLITRERFAVMVEAVYRKVNTLVDQHQDHFDAVLQRLVPRISETPPVPAILVSVEPVVADGVAG